MSKYKATFTGNDYGPQKNLSPLALAQMVESAIGADVFLNTVESDVAGKIIAATFAPNGTAVLTIECEAKVVKDYPYFRPRFFEVRGVGMIDGVSVIHSAKEISFCFTSIPNDLNGVELVKA